MSRRCVGYEGRKPIYFDEGPASAAAQKRVSVVERGGVPKHELAAPTGGAGAIERRQLYEAEDDIRAEEAREARMHRPANVKAATSQESRLRGAHANRDRVAALHVVPSPPEEPPVSDAAPNPLTTLSEAAETAAEAHRAKLLADEAWDDARGALEAAWADVVPVLVPEDDVEPPDRLPVQEIPLAGGTVMRAHSDGAPATIEALRELGEVAVAKLREEAAAPTPHKKRNAAPAEITARRRMVLSGLKAGQGRADIARDLNVTYQTVDGLIEAMAKKGEIPSELFPLLPARFAKYATVAEQ